MGNDPQAGIFALGTTSHAYLEFDILSGVEAKELVAAIVSLKEPHSTIGGVNFVSGFRPELWRSAAPDQAPDGVEGFNSDIVGAANYRMPATQHDAVLWISGSEYDLIFDVSRDAISAMAKVARVADETSSWPYHHDRDLTGFIDGSKNPTLINAPEFALIPDPGPGAGGSILLLQKWVHDSALWESLSVERQQNVMGRTKPDSIELDNKPEDSHVARTDQDVFGKIFRRNMPYGTVTDHGTMFVGFSSDQRRLVAMLENMAGLKDGVRDALTLYTRPLTGSYYFVPSISGLKPWAPPEED
jgi:putative iron-dependent peroxidase